MIWDHLTRPVAESPTDVPWSVDGLSTPWLTAVLCDHVRGAEVTAFEVVDGHQGSSVRRRINLTYNRVGHGAGLPSTVFAKTTPTILTRLASGIAAKGEALFFRDVRPDLPIEAPVLLHTGYDRASGRSIHLFDDLVATRGATFCDHTTSLNRAHAEHIVETLASVHGGFLRSDRLTSDLSWISTYESFFRVGERGGIRDGHDRAMVEAADVIAEGVLARKDQIWPMAVRALSMHKEVRTLLHSDVHLGNWYITANGKMGLCDWATVCQGHWARDLAYALTTTLAIEDRRAWERDLIAHYLDSMRQRCGLDVSFDDAWNQYRRQTFAALLMWTPTLCHPPTLPDMQPPEMSREMIRRISTAMSDLEVFEEPE